LVDGLIAEDELEFSYVPGAANGPDRWGEIMLDIMGLAH
jgi:hypothetical protein